MIFSSAHEVGVNVNGICRVGHENDVVITEDINNVAAIALCTVVYAYLICGNVRTETLVIARYSFAEKIVSSTAVLIASESFLDSHFVTALFHGFNDNGSDRQRYVTDTHSDNVCVRICFLESLYLLGNVDKEIVFFQLEEVFV